MTAEAPGKVNVRIKGSCEKERNQKKWRSPYGKRNLDSTAGKFGVWLPVLFMLAGMLASTIVGGGGLARLTGITFLPWPWVFCCQG